MPFLYQTRTIQQHAIQNKRWPIAEQSALPKTPDDHIPFEQAEHAIPLDRTDGKTTITKTEKEVFKRLFALAEAEVKVEKLPETSVGESLGQEVDGIHNQPLQVKEQRLRVVSRELRKANPALVDVSHLQEQQAEQEKQFEDIKTLLESAKTDVELWSALDTHLFQKIIQLDLDSKTAPMASKQAVAEANITAEADKTKLTKSAKKRLKRDKATATKKPPSPRIASPPSSELVILGTNYPILLVVAMQLLRTNFATSQLPFSILPSVKRIGRSSYALGASTPLYNELISLTWRTYSDFTRINELLQEMDNGGLEFDEDTLKILDEIRVEGKDIRKGKYGANRKAVWETDMMQGGWRKVIAWIPVVKEVLAEGAEREARGEEFEGLEYDADT
jgi:hypothetical protein